MFKTTRQHVQFGTLSVKGPLLIGPLILASMLSACSDSSDSADPEADTDSQMPPVTEGDNTDTPTGPDNGDTPVDGGDGIPSATSARYRLTFTATWSQETHTLNFPGNPHFSGLLGAIHNEQVVFWEPGQIATAGIQTVAETGGKSDHLAEIQSAIDAGSALGIINEGGIATSPGSRSIEFDINQDYPQISIVSMLAPSPDWFVGLHNYPLISDGEFVDTANIDLVLYDSGSDSGVRYQSPNSATDPLSPIARVNSESQDAPFINGEPIVGTISIERLLQ